MRRTLRRCCGAQRQEAPFVGQAGYPLAHANGARCTLCPGIAYDRSPCGTGTSAKLAVLAERGRLEVAEELVSRSILGTEFRARIVERTEATEALKKKGREAFRKLAPLVDSDDAEVAPRLAPGGA